MSGAEVVLPGQVAELEKAHPGGCGESEVEKRATLELLRGERDGADRFSDDHNSRLEPRRSERTPKANMSERARTRSLRVGGSLLGDQFRSSKELTSDDKRRSTVASSATGVSFKDLKFKHSFQSIPDATTSRKFSELAIKHDTAPAAGALLAQLADADKDQSPLYRDESPKQDLASQESTQAAVGAPLTAPTCPADSADKGAPTDTKSEILSAAETECSPDAKLSEEAEEAATTLPPLEDKTSAKDEASCLPAELAAARGSSSSIEPRPPRMKSFKGQVSLKTKAAIKRSNSTLAGHSLLESSSGEAEVPRRNSFVPRLMVSRASSQSSFGSKQSSEASAGAKTKRQPSFRFSSVRGGSRISLKTKAALKRSAGAS